MVLGEVTGAFARPAVTSAHHAKPAPEGTPASLTRADKLGLIASVCLQAIQARMARKHRARNAPYRSLQLAAPEVAVTDSCCYFTFIHSFEIPYIAIKV